MDLSFVAAQHKKLLEYEYRKYHELARSKGAATATAAQRSERMPERPVLSLFSDAFEKTGRPFSSLFLNEVQYVKNPKSKTHLAIKHIPFMTVIYASGAIFFNQWTDVYGFVDFLAEHPFDTEREFIRVFINHYSSRVRNPLPTARDRLIKFLMAVTEGRPASIMKLKDVRHDLVPCVLDMSSENHVLTAKFYEALRFCKAPGLGTETSDSCGATQGINKHDRKTRSKHDGIQTGEASKERLEVNRFSVDTSLFLDTIVHYCSHYLCSHVVERIEFRQHMTVLLNKMIRFIYSVYASLSPNDLMSMLEDSKRPDFGRSSTSGEDSYCLDDLVRT